MNPSEQHLNPIPNSAPTQFTLSPPQPNPNPNPNPNSSFPDWAHHRFNTPVSYVNNSEPDQPSVPRKRRGASRRPNLTLSARNSQVIIPKGAIFGHLNVKSAAVPDVSDEIIVINKDATAEALTALTAGFPADVLTDEEIDAGVVSVVGGIEQVNYILIRNHIITKWRENVSTWISKEMFINVVPSHCSKLLDSAYNYLVSHGYVNFGVAKEIKDRIPLEPSKSSVIIIGAGLAGLAAARQLMRFGFKVTVLEGRKRAGGRVYTRKVEGGNRSAAADLGGSVLTGTLGNPLGIIARQLSSSLHKVRDKCPLYMVDGKPVDSDLDLNVENAFNRLLDRASRLRQLMGEVSQDISLGSALETFRQDCGDAVGTEELGLFNWHLANLEYANAGLVSKLSLAFWDQDDPYDMGGDHCFLPGGNGRLVQALAENVPILYEKTVHTVRYTGNGVQVVAGTHSFDGDMVLCTVPLGVLKSGSIKFIPELPQRKLDGIKRLGFGLLNKVAMLFPHVFWGTDLDTFGHLTDDPSRRGEFFLFYSYATVAGGALLIALVAGEAAHTFESMPPTDAVTRVLQILRDIYEPQGIIVPEPTQTVCTRWGSDPFSFGSYSNVAVGASGDDYDILAENVGDGRVFFAGEATNRRYPATMHGAFLSGLREAAHIARYASLRALKKRVEVKPPRNPHSQATLLEDLFREPDIEFGNYALIFDKKSLDPNSLAVLRVTFSGPRKKNNEIEQQHSSKLLFQQLQSHFNQKQEFHIYTLLPRQQALELREVRGGDDMRLNFLCEKLGVKLVGRKGLGPMADSVISSIKAERGVRKSASTSSTLKSGLSKPKTAISKLKLVRRARIMRNNKGESSRMTSVAKTVGTHLVPLPSLNENVRSQILDDGNLSGSSNGVFSLSSLNENVEAQRLNPYSGNSRTSITHIAGDNKPLETGVSPVSSLSENAGPTTLNVVAQGAELVGTSAVPFSLLSHSLGDLVIANGNLNGDDNGAATLDITEEAQLVVPFSSQNQYFPSWGKLEGDINLPTADVGNSSTAPVDIPLDLVYGSISLSESYLVDSQMEEQPPAETNFSNRN